MSAFLALCRKDFGDRDTEGQLVEGEDRSGGPGRRVAGGDGAGGGGMHGVGGE